MSNEITEVELLKRQLQEELEKQRNVTFGLMKANNLNKSRSLGKEPTSKRARITSKSNSEANGAEGSGTNGTFLLVRYVPKPFSGTVICLHVP